MATNGELKVANYLMAVEGLAMIRRIVTDPGALEPRANEIAMIIRAVDQPPLSTMIDIIRHEVDPGYSMWAPRYDGPNPAIETEEPVFTELVRGIASGVRARRRVRNRKAHRDLVGDGLGRDRCRCHRRDARTARAKVPVRRSTKDGCRRCPSRTRRSTWWSAASRCRTSKTWCRSTPSSPVSSGPVGAR